MTRRRVFDRRTFLRGAGTVAIGLPLLDEMISTRALAAPGDPPARTITIFFGEGMPTHVQEDHLASLSGPLAPLKPHQPKIGFVRGVGFPQIGTAHSAGGMCSFTGVPFVDLNRAGGPSVDQVMLQELYPQGLPATMIPTLAMGFYGSYRTSGDFFRRVKSWKNDGTPSEIPKAYPSELFKRIFGDEPGAGEDRRKRSILDSVIAQYRSLASEGSNLGARSRARIKEHLERVRQYEARAFSETGCKRPDAVSDPALYKGQKSFNGVNLMVDDISTHWRLNVDLFVLAFQCDLTRVGVAHFLNVGDRIDLRGDYRYNGKLIYNFNDSRDRPSGVGDGQAVNHEHFHDWDKRGNKVAEHHMHFHMREIAYLLSKLDDKSALDANGKTLLDNAMVMMTTELSEPGAHKVSNIIHMLGSANGRFKTGGNVTMAGNGKRPAVDLYNTVLASYGIKRRLGSSGGQLLDGVRV